MADEITVVDLFCGAGGMSAGFAMAGYSIVASLDFDEDAIATFQANHPDSQTVNENIKRFGSGRMQELVGDRVDVIVGGPPCQGFSTASMNPDVGANYGKQRAYDARNSLHLEFFDYVADFKPSAFVLENVPGLKYRTDGRYLNSVLKKAKRLGYDTWVWDLMATDFGVPQARKRVFVVGTLEIDLHKPIPTHYGHESLLEPKYYTVAEAILDLPPLKPGCGDTIMQYDTAQIRRFEDDSRYRKDYAAKARRGCTLLTHHTARMHSERDLSIFRLIKAGKSSAQLPEEVKATMPYRMDCFSDKYRRQPLDRPATTITAHLAKDGLYYIHPTQDRSITPREAARLQSFRDSYSFCGTRSSVFKQIGNAVPPLLAHAIAKTVKRAIS